jgi:hypothetical protein
MTESQVLPIALASLPTMLTVLIGILINNYRLGGLRSDMNSRFADMNSRLGDMNSRLADMDFRLNGRIDDLRSHMDSRFDEMRGYLAG